MFWLKFSPNTPKVIPTSSLSPDLATSNLQAKDGSHSLCSSTVSWVCWNLHICSFCNFCIQTMSHSYGTSPDRKAQAMPFPPSRFKQSHTPYFSAQSTLSISDTQPTKEVHMFWSHYKKKKKRKMKGQDSMFPLKNFQFYRNVIQWELPRWLYLNESQGT